MNRWPWLLLALGGFALAGCGDTSSSNTPTDDAPAADSGTADAGGGPGPPSSGTATPLDGTWMLIDDDRESYVMIKDGRMAMGDEDIDMGGPCTVTRREDGKYEVHVKYDDDFLAGKEDTLVIQRDGKTITMFDKDGKAKGRYQWTEEEQ